MNLQAVVSTSIMMWPLYDCHDSLLPVHKPGGAWFLSSDKVFKYQLELVARLPIVLLPSYLRYTL